MSQLKPSYKSLFKLMIDKDITKKDLCAEFSPTTVSKLYHEKLVSMEVMMRLCEMMDCNISDIMTFIRK